jgi:hypothetical protein
MTARYSPLDTCRKRTGTDSKRGDVTFHVTAPPLTLLASSTSHTDIELRSATQSTDSERRMVHGRASTRHTRRTRDMRHMTCEGAPQLVHDAGRRGISQVQSRLRLLLRVTLNVDARLTVVSEREVRLALAVHDANRRAGREQQRAQQLEAGVAVQSPTRGVLTREKEHETKRRRPVSTEQNADASTQARDRSPATR